MSARIESNTFVGIAAIASLDGAKTVKGPSPASTAPRSEAAIAAENELRFVELAGNLVERQDGDCGGVDAGAVAHGCPGRAVVAAETPVLAMPTTASGTASTTIGARRRREVAAVIGTTVPHTFGRLLLGTNGGARLERDAMALVVQKYGGTSVADPDRMRAVAENVAFTRRHGNDVVVVVSAMGKSTDNLIALASQVSTSRSGGRWTCC